MCLRPSNTRTSDRSQELSLYNLIDQDPKSRYRMASNIPPPPGYAPGQTRFPLLLGFICPLLVLVIVLGVMRFYVRYSLHSIGLDDKLLFSAIIFFIVHSITGLWGMIRGLGRHDYDLFKQGHNPYLDLAPV